MTDTERKLRQNLLFNHHCNTGGNIDVYLDDGELQCHTCGSDFLRQSLSTIAENIDNPKSGNFFKEKS